MNDNLFLYWFKFTWSFSDKKSLLWRDWQRVGCWINHCWWWWLWWLCRRCRYCFFFMLIWLNYLLINLINKLFKVYLFFITINALFILKFSHYQIKDCNSRHFILKAFEAVLTNVVCTCLYFFAYLHVFGLYVVFVYVFAAAWISICSSICEVIAKNGKQLRCNSSKWISCWGCLAVQKSESFSWLTKKSLADKALYEFIVLNDCIVFRLGLHNKCNVCFVSHHVSSLYRLCIIIVSSL